MSDIKLIKGGKLFGNPNPKATIGFVLFYPFQFYVYKNIYKELETESEFIVDLCQPYTPAQQTLLLRDIVSLLNTHGVHYRILYPEDYHYSVYLSEFFSKYKGLVSVWVRGCMTMVQTRSIKKINPMYGAGKELTMVTPTLGVYDLILTFGSRSNTLLSYYTHAEMVGNPRFDDWFNYSLDQETLTRVRASLDPKKPTILYLPTYGDLSSIDMLSSELKKLTTTYNIIVKTHYFASREEFQRMQDLAHPGILVYGDEVDLLPLLRVADVVLSDNSSAIFDAVLADKPVLVADFWDIDFLDKQHKELRTYARGVDGATTYSDSIEQVIKRDGSVLTIANARDLGEKVAQAFVDDSFFKQKRDALRKMLFAYRDGVSAHRAATAIRQCIAETDSRPRPILYHAFEAYKRKIKTLSYGRERELLKIIDTHKGLLFEKIETDDAFVSALLVHEGGRETNVGQALRALGEQNFPTTRYEIFVIGASAEDIEASSKDWPAAERSRPNIFPVPITVTLADAVNTALERVRGKIICFTDSKHTTPSDWITKFYIAHARLTYSAGIGGYSAASIPNYTPYDEYWYQELAKKFHIEKEARPLEKLYEVTNKLFSQNPAGDLCNMSYKRTFVPTIPVHLDSGFVIAAYIKAQALLTDPLTFITQPVRRIERYTLSTFLEECKRKAFTEKLIDLSKYGYVIETKSIVDVIVDGPILALRYRKVMHWKALPFGVIVSMGHVYQWLGALEARRFFLSQHLRKKGNDFRKTSVLMRRG